MQANADNSQMHVCVLLWLTQINKIQNKNGIKSFIVIV